MIKFLLLLLFFALLKESYYFIARSLRKRTTVKKYRPSNREDKMDYSKIIPVDAIINGKAYSFSSSAEYRYALTLQRLVEIGEITAWSYEETLFAFYPKKATGKEFKPDGVKRVLYPASGLSVSDKNRVKAYLPDFCIINNDGSEEYVEVKGRWTQRAKTAVKNMKMFFPKIKLTVKYV